MRDTFSVLFFVSVGMLFDPATLINQPFGVFLTVLISLPSIRHAGKMPTEKNAYFSLEIQILRACRKDRSIKNDRNVGFSGGILSPRVKPMTNWLGSLDSNLQMAGYFFVIKWLKNIISCYQTIVQRRTRSFYRSHFSTVHDLRKVRHDSAE